MLIVFRFLSDMTYQTINKKNNDYKYKIKSEFEKMISWSIFSSVRLFSTMLKICQNLKFTTVNHDHFQILKCLGFKDFT